MKRRPNIIFRNMTIVDRKRALAQNILCKVVAAQESNFNGAYKYKQATVYVPELVAFIGANGILVDKSDKRCKMQFIKLESGRFFLIKSVVTTYEKLDCKTRHIIEEFILGLEAIGKVKPFENCPEYISGMKPNKAFYKFLAQELTDEKQ